MKTINVEDSIITVGYPDVKVIKNKGDIALRILGVISIAISLIVGVINWLTWNQFAEYWSLIIVGTLIYIWLLFSQIIMSKHDYPTKAIRQVIIVSILLVILDLFTGHTKWAMTYVVPFLFLGTTALLPLIIATMPKKYFLHVRSLFFLVILDLLVSIVPFTTDWMEQGIEWTGAMVGLAGIILLAIMWVFAPRTTKQELVKIFRI
ncbi:hypothetical protein JV173_03920 [Acholeplasma equirhinis]|uniref:DUF6320 domain-containing protein n=1 Tax=Acholeplasma equirhinis TaxID=555393 RepID=UPI00197AB287|nr:DUF6320 domain-containing protein [Acholeplasma equirhinis]MBN3490657.1 hypothetical protein [Acholeplasma equirhinis]